MQDTDKSLTEIAQLVGFKDSQHYSKLFMTSHWRNTLPVTGNPISKTIIKNDTFSFRLIKNIAKLAPHFPATPIFSLLFQVFFYVFYKRITALY